MDAGAWLAVGLVVLWWVGGVDLLRRLARDWRRHRRIAEPLREIKGELRVRE